MTLHLWLAPPLAHELGRALAHFLWQGALLAAALRVTLFLGAERSSRWRHQAALFCLLALPLAFGITLALSLSGGHSTVAAPPAAPRVVFNPVIAGDAPAAPVDWLAWLAPLWMGGVILFYAFRLAGWLRVDRMRRRGVCAAPAEWQQRLRALAAAVRISQPVVLLESCLAGVPLVIGYWRPVILMPLGALAGLSVEQVEAILIHELAHIRRADYLVSMAQSLIEGLFFFHPAVWWISAVVRAEREYACDDVVVALRPDARAYAAALTTLEQSRWPAIQPAAASNGGNLVRRIRRLLGEPGSAQVPNARVAALAGALALVVAVAAALVAWPPTKSFAQSASPAESSADKQEPAKGIEPAHQSIEDLQELLAGKQKKIQEAEETVERAQELLQRNAADLDRALQNGGAHSVDFALEERMRKAEAALQELAAQVRQSQDLVDQQRLTALLNQLDAEQQAGKSQQLLQQQERALRQKWLNEDVAYIISPEERREFLVLQTDADRDRFIERFWQRRDPTPDTAENEFKEEHYRRIAYANEHFASSVPGWKTDRGRIYIVYGPPDEIEDHRSESVPRQVWRYVHIDRVGYDIEVEFTDPGGTGELRMVAAPASHGSYWQLMVSASDAAGAVARSLRTGGFPILTYPVQGRPGMVQVLVGPYPDEASLAKAKAALEAGGYHPVRGQ